MLRSSSLFRDHALLGFLTELFIDDEFEEAFSFKYEANENWGLKISDGK